MERTWGLITFQGPSQTQTLTCCSDTPQAGKDISLFCSCLKQLVVYNSHHSFCLWKWDTIRKVALTSRYNHFISQSKPPHGKLREISPLLLPHHTATAATCYCWFSGNSSQFPSRKENGMFHYILPQIPQY